LFRQFPKHLVVLTFISALAACSNKQIYESTQLNRQNECYKLPDAQIDECMEQHKKSFDEYDRKRQELLEEEDN